MSICCSFSRVALLHGFSNSILQLEHLLHVNETLVAEAVASEQMAEVEDEDRCRHDVEAASVERVQYVNTVVERLFPKICSRRYT